MRIIALMMLASLIMATPSPAQDGSIRIADVRAPARPDDFGIKLTVDEAIEEGPIICTVTLENRTRHTLEYFAKSADAGAFCTVHASWKPRERPPITGIESSSVLRFIEAEPETWFRLSPGATVSKRVYLHSNFLSTRAGNATVRFGWSVDAAAKDMDDGRDKPKHLFNVQSEQAIAIKAATDENLAPVLAKLEAEFSRIVHAETAQPGKTEEHQADWAAFFNCIHGCRQRQFVPLLFRAIEQLRSRNDQHQLIADIYDSFPTPQEGFAAIADSLSTHRPPIAAYLFDYWFQEDLDHLWSQERQAELNQPAAKNDPSGGARRLTQRDEDAWRSSKRHLDTRLTKEQFARLRDIKDVWVRALLYAHYPDQCPKPWVDALTNDLKQFLRPSERFAALVAQLDHDRFKVREEATRELIELSRIFDRQLLEISEDKLSPEVQERLRRVRSRSEQAKLPPLWQSTIDCLAWNPDPRARQVLEILRTAESRNRISDAAQKAFETQQMLKKEEKK
jgi:hypothetical protein